MSLHKLLHMRLKTLLATLFKEAFTLATSGAIYRATCVEECAQCVQECIRAF